MSQNDTAFDVSCLYARYLEQLHRAERRALESSPMYMNPEMTVTELIDVVAFLNSRYRVLPDYTEYYYSENF